MSFTLEIIAFDIESCRTIGRAGAHRIELCDNPGDGGTTASAGMIRQARKLTDLPLFPIIRPRGGDFLYNDDEYSIMKEDIRICRAAGCDGIVTGILTPDGGVDYERMARLTELAYPMDVTFHRAFDRTADPLQALEDIIRTGCTRILTSGQQKTAPEGASLINQLISAAEDRIIIMPGSGVRSDNICQLARETGAVEFHSSARRTKNGNMSFQHPVLSADSGIVTADEQEIRQLLEQLSQLS